MSELATLWLSAKIAFAATLLIMPLAIALAYWLTFKRPRFAPLLETLISLPLILPPVALGYGLLLIFGKNGLGLNVAFTFWAAVIAAATVSLPLATRSVRIAMGSLHKQILEASATLGAKSWPTFLWVILPLSWPGILGGSTLAFMRSLGEFGATMVFAGNLEGETRTLSLAMWSAFEQPDGQEASLRLLLITILLAIFAQFLSEIWMRKIR